jgi:NAD(P)-dependent dehydrogenase (short-subunit alcohol dehydrogenase family)
MSKVVVITGASAGIGAATAKLLGSQGHQLALAARREPELRAAAAAAGQALVVPMDVTRRADHDRLRDAALREFGRIDVWINNAGRGITRRVLDLTDDDLDQIFAVNLKSALYGMQCVVPYFQQRGEGHLINVSSFLSRVPFATFRSAYNAAKAGLNALTANLRVDLRATHPGVHVSLVMPGVVRTEFPRVALGASPTQPPFAGPSQSAEEVAAVIAALIEHPVAEVYTNPAQAKIAEQYYHDVGAFEENAAKQGPWPPAPPKS